jgi:hypothetical protein
MKTGRWIVFLAGFVLLAADALCQTTIPAGTVLPVRLDSVLSMKMKVGSNLTARLMQNVPLRNGESIRAGAKVIGQVIAVNPAKNGTAGNISFRFDRIVASSRTIPVTTDLRAVAGLMAVEDAQIPDMGSDRGTSPDNYTTEQIGGDVVYRGGGPVKEGSETVGEPVYDGVLSRVRSNGTGCRGEVAGNSEPQALWVFSADACGTYGLPGVSIVHAGRTNPVGEIALAANGRRLHVPAGSGMLLRVIGSSQTEQASRG